MKYGTIPGLRFPASRVAQGTIMVGSENWDKSAKLLDATLEGGCNLYDTAYVYGGGDNERSVGRWINSRGIREQVLILGKGAHPSDGRNKCNPEDITHELGESLERFGTDYIDLYILHRDDPAVPIGEIVDVLNEHKRAGRIHAFGGSNWSVKRIRAANEYAAKNGLTPFAVSSPQYSLARAVKPMWDDCVSISGPEHAADREWYATSGVALVTWSSVARGFFSGKFGKSDVAKMKEMMEGCAFDGFCSPDNLERLDRAFALAKEKGLSVPQIALAYVLNTPLNIFALVGSCTPDEFKENLTALEIELTPREMAWLNMECSDR